jgi:hypothetical protein
MILVSEAHKLYKWSLTKRFPEVNLMVGHVAPPPQGMKLDLELSFDPYGMMMQLMRVKLILVPCTLPISGNKSAVGWVS